MTLYRKKLSKSAIILLALAAIGLIALPIVHFTGLYDCSFLGGWATEAAMVASTSGWIAAAFAIGFSALGFGLCYILKDYVIGMEGNSTNMTATNTGTYQPVGQTISGNDTVVSQ